MTYELEIVISVTTYFIFGNFLKYSLDWKVEIFFTPGWLKSQQYILTLLLSIRHFQYFSFGYEKCFLSQLSKTKIVLFLFVNCNTRIKIN